MFTQNNITDFKLSRDDIIDEAIHRCKKEMYAKAQPSVDYDLLLEQYKQGCQEKLYDRYFLSREECKYIVKKYVEIYHLESGLGAHLDLLLDNMEKGTIKDKWIQKKTTNGSISSGYRGYEDVPPLSKIIGEKHAKVVTDYIKERKEFYNRDHEKEQFEFALYLGDVPASDEKTVIEYWKTKGVNLTIDPRKHTNDYFWSEENGYLEEDEI